jgi:hypothetical protein
MQQEVERSKTSHGKQKNDLNPKMDFVEFVVNSRTKRLEKFIENQSKPKTSQRRRNIPLSQFSRNQ